MALLAGAMCGVRNDSCSRKHKYARTSHGMASESMSRGVHLFFAQESCFFKQEHGPPTGSKQVKTDVLLTTVLGLLRWAEAADRPADACDWPSEDRVCLQKPHVGLLRPIRGTRVCEYMPITGPWATRGKSMARNGGAKAGVDNWRTRRRTHTACGRHFRWTTFDRAAMVGATRRRP